MIVTRHDCMFMSRLLNAWEFLSDGFDDGEIRVVSTINEDTRLQSLQLQAHGKTYTASAVQYQREITCSENFDDVAREVFEHLKKKYVHESSIDEFKEHRNDFFYEIGGKILRLDYEAACVRHGFFPGRSADLVWGGGHHV